MPPNSLPTQGCSPEPAPTEAPEAGDVLLGQQRRLFHDDAVEAYLANLRESELLRVAPPWTRAVFLVATSLVAMAIAMASAGDVEQTSTARGILRVTGGSHLLTTRVSGRVTEVRAHSGDAVAAGDIIALLDSASLAADVYSAEREVARALTRLETFERTRRPSYATRRYLLQQKAELLSQRGRLQAETIARWSERAESFTQLLREGATSRMDQLLMTDELAAAQRDRVQIQEELVQSQLAMASLDEELQGESSRLALALSEARDARDSLAFALEQTKIVAPAAGRLEAVLVKLGDGVPIGALVGRLVPVDAPLEIVAFLPERDRAFVTPGSRARVELDQLPVSEFGALDAEVVRIARELSSAPEVREAFGEDAEVRDPMVRIEVALDETVTLHRIEPYLRSGSLLTVRLIVRQRRIITLLLEPLSRWFR